MGNFKVCMMVNLIFFWEFKIFLVLEKKLSFWKDIRKKIKRFINFNLSVFLRYISLVNLNCLLLLGWNSIILLRIKVIYM